MECTTKIDLNTPVEELDISPRLKGRLRSGGIPALRDLVNSTERRVSGITRMGEATLNEAREFLKSHGLYFKGHGSFDAMLKNSLWKALGALTTLGEVSDALVAFKEARANLECPPPLTISEFISLCRLIDLMQEPISSEMVNRTVEGSKLFYVSIALEMIGVSYRRADLSELVKANPELFAPDTLLASLNGKLVNYSQEQSSGQKAGNDLAPVVLFFESGSGCSYVVDPKLFADSIS